MSLEKYFVDKKNLFASAVKLFIAFILVFSVVYFLWSVMRYNQIKEEQLEKQAYVERLQNEIDELEYLVEAPLDDNYKIRIAREKLGMCFPDEIIYYTDLD